MNQLAGSPDLKITFFGTLRVRNVIMLFRHFQTNPTLRNVSYLVFVREILNHRILFCT